MRTMSSSLNITLCICSLMLLMTSGLSFQMLPMLFSPVRYRRCSLQHKFKQSLKISDKRTTSQYPPPQSFILFSNGSLPNEIVEILPESGPFWRARKDCWRPDVRDVENISWGLPAKKKGTGSRGVPHRLNEDERRAFDQARRQGFLQVQGSSWRSQRRDSPLLNSYRSLMDALGRPAIVLHKLNPSSGGGDSDDVLVIDLSPLRFPAEFNHVALKLKDMVADETNVEGLVELDQLPDDDEGNDEIDDPSNDPYATRPIYQIAPYSLRFNVTRQQGKGFGKMFASVFETVDEKVATSKKPQGVKPGKSRRSGGYGIG